MTVTKESVQYQQGSESTYSVRQNTDDLLTAHREIRTVKGKDKRSIAVRKKPHRYGNSRAI